MPDDDRGDLHGVAGAVVDLELLSVQGARPQRDLVARQARAARLAARPLATGGAVCVERVGPEEADLAGRAPVAAEEDEHAGLVGLQGEVTKGGQGCQHEERADKESIPARRDPRDDQGHRGGVQRKRDRRHDPTAHRSGFTFRGHGDPFGRRLLYDFAMISLRDQRYKKLPHLRRVPGAALTGIRYCGQRLAAAASRQPSVLVEADVMDAVRLQELAWVAGRPSMRPSEGSGGCRFFWRATWA